MFKKIIFLITLCFVANLAQEQCQFPSCISYSESDACEVECFPNKNNTLLDSGNGTLINKLTLTNFTSLSDDFLNGSEIIDLVIDAGILTEISDYAFRGIIGLQKITFKNLENPSLIKSQLFEDLNETVTSFLVIESTLDEVKVSSLISELSSLSNLQTLGFKFNNLTSVNINVSLFENLQYLDLESNQIESAAVEGKFFVLILNSNNIKSTQDISLNVNGLIGLYIESNVISTLPANLFSSIDLQFASFASNNISNVDQNAFTSMTSLYWLRLTYNKLRNVSLNIPDRVLTLDLGYCDLGNFRASDLNVKSIENLVLVGNSIDELPDDFYSIVHSTKWIDLSNNFLKSASFLDNYRFEKLTELYLSNNKIESVTKSQLENAPALETIDLSDNYIKQIEFPVLLNLTKINLNSNLIKILNSTSFSSVTNLAKIQLAQNLITIVRSNTFSKNKELTELILDENYLSKFPNISTLYKLEYFSLKSQNGKLINIPDFAFERKLLKNDTTSELTIDLYDNAIKKVGDKAFCNRFSSFLAAQKVTLRLMGPKKIHRCKLPQFKSNSVIISTKYKADCFLQAYGAKYNVQFESENPSNCSNLTIKKDLCSSRKRYSCPLPLVN